MVCVGELRAVTEKFRAVMGQWQALPRTGWRDGLTCWLCKRRARGVGRLEKTATDWRRGSRQERADVGLVGVPSRVLSSFRVPASLPSASTCLLARHNAS